jgi:hypothetical protein
VRRWRELVADRKNGRTLFDRPKPTVGCSANGREEEFFSARHIPIAVYTEEYLLMMSSKPAQNM